MAKPDHSFAFGTKAETLERLSCHVGKSSVPGFVYFSHAEWHSDPAALAKRVAGNTPEGATVIVRSSALGEDSELFAQAGAFLSVPHIDPRDRAALDGAIAAVFASYGRAAGEGGDDQVLIQTMVSDVTVSGVIFTQVMSTGAPYYVINYDDESGATDTITSGTGYTNRTVYIARRHADRLASDRFTRLLDAVREIEALCGDSNLDIEFAIDSALNVHLFQVRRITTMPNWRRGLALRIDEAIEQLLSAVGPQLIGETPHGTVLGKMPDWNPAEIIGNAPRRLAYSLYRALITDRAWREARARMGYFEPRGQPLMRSCAGQPYIDVRASFRSFIPASLEPALAERMVDHWLNRLAAHPELHDKVEFEIALTAWSFDFEERARRLLPPDFTQEERAAIESAYKALTRRVIEKKRGGIKRQVKLVQRLERTRRALPREDGGTAALAAVAALFEDTVDQGTVPFSILARHGFIARTLLDGLEAGGYLDAADRTAFSRSFPTVASDFIADTHRVQAGEIAQTEFMERYGHLRPGTYDILSPRYDQREIGLADGTPRGEGEAHPPFTLPPGRMQAITDLLARSGFGIDGPAFFDYCVRATQGREWAKLVFTRGVSDGLEILARWGEAQGLSREELADLDLSDFIHSLTETPATNLESVLRARAEKRAAEHAVTTGIKLPYIIARASDLVVVPMMLDQPNFVTLEKVSGPVLILSNDQIDPATLDGQVLMIESADPGFDWIFTRKIRGLITKFGGANSHMAIRCAEFNIPAAIGCGEQIFERISRTGAVDLDCANGTIAAGGQ